MRPNRELLAEQEAAQDAGASTADATRAYRAAAREEASTRLTNLARTHPLQPADSLPSLTQVSPSAFKPITGATPADDATAAPAAAPEPASRSSESRRTSAHQIRDAAMTAEGGAKAFLRGLTSEELALLQKDAGLADPINVERLSEEGAENLVREREAWVDLNNDGLVERGAGKLIVFPPVNAPSAVKDAWSAATAGMSRRDAATMELGLSLPFTLAAHLGTSRANSDLAAGTHDWGRHIADAIEGHEAGRRHNQASPVMRETWESIASGLKRFQAELRARGMA